MKVEITGKELWNMACESMEVKLKEKYGVEFFVVSDSYDTEPMPDKKGYSRIAWAKFIVTPAKPAPEGSLTTPEEKDEEGNLTLAD